MPIHPLTAYTFMGKGIEMPNIIHSFDSQVATDHGVPAAIIHQEFLRWCKDNENKKVKEVCVDGEYYAFRSLSQLHNWFPYFSKRTIQRAIEILLGARLLEKRSRGLDKNPSAMMYRTMELGVDRMSTGVDKMATGGGQNEPTGDGQNGYPLIEQYNMNSTKNKDVPAPPERHIAFCEGFKDKELERSPNQERLRSPEWEKKTLPAWLKVVDQIVRLDNVDIEDLIKLHRVVLKDQFWAKQVQSPLYYRKRDGNGRKYYERLSSDLLGSIAVVAPNKRSSSNAYDNYVRQVRQS
jgi:hypothetical protein